MTTSQFDWAPSLARPLIDATIAAAQDDARVVGLTVGGSVAAGTMDEFSDLDFVVVCRDENQPELLHNAQAFAAELGPLLASFTGEHAGEPLSRYAVKVEASTGELRSVARPRLFETSHGLRQPQHRLFALDSLGECGWLKALRLEGYAPRRPRGPLTLQQALFPYAEAL